MLVEEGAETFAFGKSSSSPVTQQITDPIGMEGRSCEVKICIIPDAWTPLLLAQDDLRALKAVRSFGSDEFQARALNGRRRKLACTRTGHCIVFRAEFTEKGHVTPPKNRAERYRPLVSGPSLTIYQASQSYLDCEAFISSWEELDDPVPILIG